MSRSLFVVFLAGVASITAPRAQTPNTPVKTITVSIDAAKTAPPISPYIYGQFIEHIGDLINRSLWAEMLDDDTYAWFKSHGGLTRDNGERYRDLILSRGHTMDYGDMFRAFYGKDPDIGPLLENRGLAKPKAHKAKKH